MRRHELWRQNGEQVTESERSLPNVSVSNQTSFPAHRPDLSIVLPAYRSAQVLARNVPRLLDYLRTLGIAHEVLVVDDGSRDDGSTRAVAEELGCRYLELSRNSGKGAAVRKGMLSATGRYRIFTDADIPFELDTVRTVLYYLDFKEFHFVAGDRTLAESHYFTGIPLIRRIGSSVCSTIVGRFIAGGCVSSPVKLTVVG